jgi:hypothetical protein
MTNLVLNLVEGGTTITLNSSSKKVKQYKPVAPTINPDTLQKIMAGSVERDLEPTVTESCVVIVQESSVANLQTAINAIERMITLSAPRRQWTRQGNQVFVKFTPANAAAAYRSEIVNGKVEVQDDTLRVSRWDVFAVEIIIAWTRKFYWEADSETQLTLTNGNGTDDTAGLAVYNCNDGSGASPTKRNNYVEIDAAELTGVIPCPVRLAITNTYGTAARRVYVAHKAQGTPASFTHILEAEDATLNGSYCTSGADATCSNGNKVAVVNVPAAVATLFTWTMNATQAGYIKGQWVRPILRFSVLPNDATCSVRFTIKDSTSGAVIAQTDYQVLSSADYLQALPEFYLSPNLQGQTTSGAIKILLDSKDSAATCDWTLDFLQLSPIEAGNSFRFLRPVDESLVTIAATTGLITDNMIDGGLYIESQQGVYQGLGGPIMLIPSTLQRLYFLVDGASDAAIARTITVKGYFRPRKLTV